MREAGPSPHSRPGREVRRSRWLLGLGDTGPQRLAIKSSVLHHEAQQQLPDAGRKLPLAGAGKGLDADVIDPVLVPQAEMPEHGLGFAIIHPSNDAILRHDGAEQEVGNDNLNCSLAA